MKCLSVVEWNVTVANMEHPVIKSADRAGHSWVGWGRPDRESRGNAAVETHFETLKCESFHWCVYMSLFHTGHAVAFLLLLLL